MISVVVFACWSDPRVARRSLWWQHFSLPPPPARTATPFFQTPVGMLSTPSALVLFRSLIILVMSPAVTNLNEKLSVGCSLFTGVSSLALSLLGFNEATKPATFSMKNLFWWSAVSAGLSLFVHDGRFAPLPRPRIVFASCQTLLGPGFFFKRVKTLLILSRLTRRVTLLTINQ